MENAKSSKRTSLSIKIWKIMKGVSCEIEFLKRYVLGLKKYANWIPEKKFNTLKTTCKPIYRRHLFNIIYTSITPYECHA